MVRYWVAYSGRPLAECLAHCQAEIPEHSYWAQSVQDSAVDSIATTTRQVRFPG